MGSKGRLQYMRTPMQVDAGFVRRARAHGSPEARMRFSSPCVEGSCQQWTGEGCGVVLKVLAALDGADLPASVGLQPCVIRASCRWWEEKGAPACEACQYVVTDQEALAAE